LILFADIIGATADNVRFCITEKCIWVIPPPVFFSNKIFCRVIVARKFEYVKAIKRANVMKKFFTTKIIDISYYYEGFE